MGGIVFVVLSVIEICVDYGGVNVFHIVLIFASSMVLGFVSMSVLLYVSYVWVLFVVM